MPRRILGCLAVLAASALGQEHGDAGLFTREQAQEGEKLYKTLCATCHGPQLAGAAGPAIAGPKFTARWAPSRSVDDLFYLMKTTMPPGGASAISAKNHVAILAYILERNGYAAGASALVAGSSLMKQTKIKSSGDAAAAIAPAFVKGDGVAPKGFGPTQIELNAAAQSTRDWLYHTHDYSGSRHVAADQINASNASQLRAVCAYQVGDMSNFQVGPIVYNGTMYITTLHTTVAIDATTCRPKWRYTWEPKGDDIWPSNRGVAIKDGLLVRGTSDGYLLELSAVTGKLIWARKVADTSEGETFTMSPLIFEDLILIGPAGSENDISGWVGAFRLTDGSLVWKFKTVPGAREGKQTWPNPKGIVLGGGSTWTPFSLDAEKGELFVAVTNPAPDLPAHMRPGDNLYTNSLVALDVRTGQLRWYKQMIKNDSHDWDLTQVSPLFKTKIGGRESSLVATSGKDGMLRTIDRNSREVVNSTAVTTIENANIPVTTKPIHACPGVMGGVEWNGPAYNPATNLLYVGAVDWCGTFTAFDESRRIAGKMFMGGTVKSDKPWQGWITAVDATSGAVKWKYRSEKPVVAAVTTTSGNLVLAGELNGDFVVFDARSGDVLYRFNTGGPMGGGVVSYVIGGKQYIAVASGWPSKFWVDENSGSPTMMIFALP